MLLIKKKHAKAHMGKSTFSAQASIVAPRKVWQAAADRMVRKEGILANVRRAPLSDSPSPLSSRLPREKEPLG